MYIGFENDKIKYVGRHKPQKEKDNNEIIFEADTVTPGFVVLNQLKNKYL